MNKLIKTTGISLLSITLGVVIGMFYSASAQNEKAFELRVYTATPGNLDNLHARFRDHTTRIFAKHGMEVVAYWTPTDEEKADDTLIYVLEHASREAADASWQAFIQDPEWQEVAAASNANGQILAGIEREYMVATDYSPLQ
ncbi:MAG: NIPSNAP family protein [Pseudomonadales bacterium]|nr:NIPSNAP family protein [Pseudomonadales bacterium]